MEDKLKQMLAMSPGEFQSMSCDNVETLMLHSLLNNAIKGDANAVIVVAKLSGMDVSDRFLKVL